MQLWENKQLLLKEYSMGVNPGGRQGDMSPQISMGGGHDIRCPPPPTLRKEYCRGSI